MPPGREPLTAAALAVLAVATSCVATKAKNEKPDGALAPAASAAATHAAPQPAASAPAPARATDASDTWPARSARPAASARPASASLERLARDQVAPELARPDDLGIGPISVTGGIVPNPRLAVMRMKSAFRACLAGKEPGRLTLDIVVPESGSVVTATATGVVDLDPGAVDCIERRARAATLQPAVGEPAHVLVPLSWGLPPGDK